MNWQEKYTQTQPFKEGDKVQLIHLCITDHKEGYFRDPYSHIKIGDVCVITDAKHWSDKDWLVATLNNHVHGLHKQDPRWRLVK